MSHAPEQLEMWSVGAPSEQQAQPARCALAPGSPSVAALFVQADGCYSKLENVDMWPAERDARLYAGPLPVVAHPPCHLWVNLAALNYKRYGGEHNRPGNDGGCFEAALAAVRKWGGVLEHPAFSNAWRRYGLAAPRDCGWQRNAAREWVCEVWQSAYGHKARKRTWLFYSGNAAPCELRWTRVGGSHQCGWFDRIKPTLSKREANATPPEFRDELIRLAMMANDVQCPRCNGVGRLSVGWGNSIGCSACVGTGNRANPELTGAQRPV